MILLLNILKKNKNYYISLVNTEQDNEVFDYRLVNALHLSQCNNVRFQKFLSSKQNPCEYLSAEFDVSRLIINEANLKNKIKDFQIISVYYDGDTPCLFSAVDREGKVSIHDISELEYTKNSIFGNDINSLPSFVKHEPVENAYTQLSRLDDKIEEIPCGLLKQYLKVVKGFEEGYHTVTRVNNGIELDVHEELMYKGSATVKLIQYIPKDNTLYLTKQDYLSDPYPVERTSKFLPGSIILVGSNILLNSCSRSKLDILLGTFDEKSLVISMPFTKETFKAEETFYKSKRMYMGWHLNHKKSLPREVYANILPNEIFKLPNRFYFEMKNKPFNLEARQLINENNNIDNWIYTVSLFFLWKVYSFSFKQKLKPVMKDFKVMYENALNNLVRDLGPKNALYVMSWTQEHLKKAMLNIAAVNSDENILFDTNDVDDTLFSFYQNTYDLPEVLKIYASETIDQYGGEEKLRNDFINSSKYNQRFIINTLEKIEKSLANEDNKIRISNSIDSELKKLTNKNLLR